MKKDLIGAAVWAGAMVALAFAAKAAHALGYIDGDVLERAAIIPTGLWLAWYGNRLPKTFVRNAAARRAQRVSAWSMVLSGLAYAALWAFAPMPIAVVAGCGAILAGMAITLGYCLYSDARAKA